MKSVNIKLISLLALLAISFSFASQTHKLPELNNGYSKYNDFIDSHTMKIHHLEHHQSYVNKLNKSLHGTIKENESLNSILLNISFFKNVDIRYNAGGHYNHSLFWDILNPNASKEIDPQFQKVINQSFSNFEGLEKEMKSALLNQIGTGWIWLIVSPKGKLLVTSTSNEDNPIMDVVSERGVPIIGIDNWEHAYYIKYKNNKEDYFNAIWSLIDWEIISNKFIQAIESQLFENLKVDNWPELKVYKDIMSHTFHAGEDGDLNAIRSLSKDLMLNSIYLRNSNIPIEFTDDKTIKALVKLEKQSLEIHELCLNKESDKVIWKKLQSAHNTFHVIQGLCKHHDEHFHHFNER